MARPIRLEFPGALYHITARGDRAYKEFVARGKGQPAPRDELRGQVYLGSEEFVSELMNSIDSGQDLSEISQWHKSTRHRKRLDGMKSGDLPGLV